MKIEYRERITDYLIERGFDKHEALEISEFIRKGKASSKVFKKE